VPATHEQVEKLPAVSGSSGRLVIEKTAEAGQERSWPGQVFADPNRDYSEAMLTFVAASHPVDEAVNAARDEAGAPTLKAQQQALRQEEEQLRQERRKVRQRRQLEDAAWQTMKRERQVQTAAAVTPSPTDRAAQDSQWRHLRQQRRENLAQRNEDDQAWKQQRLNLRQRWSQLPIVTAWIAILVVTDNCTRQCLGLPLFVAGSSVTAEMIVEALRRLLPPELLFLISDRGIHFRTDAFRTLMRQAEFIHVLIARHRPQSNGIAERFVRSLKEWLRNKSWQDDQELALLLEHFLAKYNDRPHQGLPIPGLSPNEFAKRIWLF
jgi:transposase InsO family protein